MADTYTIAMQNQTIVANATLIFLRAATAITSRASVLEIERITITQEGTSTSQQLGATFGLKASAFGTYVSATPAPHNVGGIASAIAGGTTGAAATCGVNASAEGAGTFTIIHNEGFNNLNGYLWVPTPQEKLYILPDQAFIVKIRGTPTTLSGWNATLCFNEFN